MMNGTPALPAWPDEHLAGLSLEQLVDLLIRDEDRAPRNVIDHCAARGEEMVAQLRAALDSDHAWRSEVSPGEWWLLLHAAMILGLIASESAGLLLVRLMRRMTLARDDNLQDWLAGYWPCLFANKPRPAVEAARALCEDHALDWYIRCQAADVVIDAATRDAARALERDIDWLAGWLRASRTRAQTGISGSRRATRCSGSRASGIARSSRTSPRDRKDCPRCNRTPAGSLGARSCRRFHRRLSLRRTRPALCAPDRKGRPQRPLPLRQREEVQEVLPSQGAGVTPAITD